MAFKKPPFVGPKLKVERANRHIDELNAVLRDFLASEFYSFGIEPHEGLWALAYRPVKPLPNTIPLIIGDVVHNLRASLDHLAVEVLASAGPVPKDFQFPFHKSGKQLPTDHKVAAIEQALPGSRRLIVDEMQPHADGDGALYALHLLDRIDKHNLLIATVEPIMFRNINTRRPDGSRYLIGLNIILDSQNPFAPFILDECTLDDDVEASFEVLFAKGGPAEDEPVIPTLIQLSQLVSNHIKAFESLIQ